MRGRAATQPLTQAVHHDLVQRAPQRGERQGAGLGSAGHPGHVIGIMSVSLVLACRCTPCLRSHRTSFDSASGDKGSWRTAHRPVCVLC